MTKTWDVVTVAAATGTGVLGGVFFAFSAFVMSGLTRLPGARGLEAMNSINVTAQRPPLMIALFGTAALCVALIVRAVRTWGDHQAPLLLIGAMLYLVGVVVMTAAFHVPLNNKMAALSPDDVTRWQADARNWTLGNHLRTLTSIAATVVLVSAVLQSARTAAQRPSAAAVVLAPPQVS